MPLPAGWFAAKRRERALRKRCRALLDALDVTRPFDLAAFQRSLSRHRGRPVTLVPIAMRTDSPSGVWIAADDADYVFYESATLPLHQLHIILHEVGHMLLDHHGAEAPDHTHWQRLFPHLSPDLVRTVMGRTSYDSDEEQAAEEFAWLACEYAGLTPNRPARQAYLDPALGNNIDRITQALGAPGHEDPPGG